MGSRAALKPCSAAPQQSATTHSHEDHFNADSSNDAGIGSRAGARPHSAAPQQSATTHSNEWNLLSACMGEVDRMRSSVAKDAAAMQAMGVLVEAKALKLDMHGMLNGIVNVRVPKHSNITCMVRFHQLSSQAIKAVKLDMVKICRPADSALNSTQQQYTNQQPLQCC